MTTGDDSGGGWDDDRLLDELGDAVRSGRGVPERFREVGRAAYTWKDIDLELAALAYDSAVSGLPAGVRAAATARMLTFEAEGLTLEVELSGSRVVGQVVPAREGTVELLVDGVEPRSVALDEHGWFDLGAPPAGPFRLCVRVAGAAAVLTDRIHPEAGAGR